MVKDKFTKNDFEQAKQWLKKMGWWKEVEHNERRQSGWYIIADANKLWIASNGGTVKDIDITHCLSQ